MRDDPRMEYLQFESSEGGAGEVAFDAMASTRDAQHEAVMAEVRAVLDWCRGRAPGGEGPVDEGFDWHHELQVHDEAGGWRTVSLTVVASARFAPDFADEFLPRDD